MNFVNLESCTTLAQICDVEIKLIVDHSIVLFLLNLDIQILNIYIFVFHSIFKIIYTGQDTHYI